MKITQEEYQAALQVVKAYRDQLKGELDQVVTEVRKAEEKNDVHKYSTLCELKLTGQCSTRLHNVIHNNLEALGITTLPSTDAKVKVGDLEGVSVLKLLSCLNVGATTLKEFKELCAICGVSWAP